MVATAAGERPAAGCPVSFAAPLVLLGLVVLPLLAAGYLVHQRRRRRDLAAFVSPALTAAIAPRPAGRRRHVPIILLGLAIGLLIAAAARPQRSRAEPVHRAAVMLVNDVSDSMTATDVRPSRLAAARAAARRLVSAVPRSVLIGQIAFARRAVVLQSPTVDHALTRTAIADLRPGGGGTAIGEAVIAALGAIAAAPRAGGPRPPGTIVLLSDGHSNIGPDPVRAARRARAEHVVIDTIALGTPHGVIESDRGRHRQVAVPVSPGELAQIAAASGGHAYRALTAATARSIYARLATAIGHVHRRQTLAPVVAGGGLVLLALSGAGSLAWLGRLA